MLQILPGKSCKLLEERKRGYENNNKVDIRGINCENELNSRFKLALFGSEIQKSFITLS